MTVNDRRQLEAKKSGTGSAITATGVAVASRRRNP